MIHADKLAIHTNPVLPALLILIAPHVKVAFIIMAIVLMFVQLAFTVKSHIKKAV